MARDPVCGTEVPEEKAPYRVRQGGETFYFCSERCRSAFEGDPAKFFESSGRRMSEKRKVVVVGAGQVGATFSFALMTSGLASDIVLINRDPERAEGHAMDLNHGLSFVQPSSISAGTYSDCKDAGIVVVTAGAAQKPGETRMDLARKNAGIFQDIIPRIAEQDPGIILVVSNPVDILTHAALKISGYPMNRVIGSGTALDTARFRFLISRHCRVDPRNVHAYIIGEHGDSEVPLWSQVNIAGVPFHVFCRTCNQGCSPEEKEGLFEQTKNAAYEIIQRKGYTNFAISLALVRIAGSILRDENSVLTVSSLIDDDHYGIEDVCLSVPAIINKNGIFRHIDIRMDEAERDRLRSSAEVLKETMGQLNL